MLLGNKTLTLEQNQKLFDIEISIIDIFEERKEHGINFKYDIEMSKNGKKRNFEFHDSIYNYKKNIQELSLSNVMEALLLDYSFVVAEKADIDNIQQILIDEFEMKNIREIKKTSEALLNNYEMLNEMFSAEQIEELYDEISNYEIAG